MASTAPTAGSLAAEAFVLKRDDALLDQRGERVDRPRQVMSGECPLPPHVARQTACVRFFAPPAGRLQAIRGVEALDSADPRLVRSSIDVDTGSIIRPLTSSFSRVGHVITAASNAADARRCADSLVGQIEFVVG